MDRRSSLGRGTRLGDPRRAAPARLPPTTPFRADAFELALAPGWADATTYTIAGPVMDGQMHLITVVTSPHGGRSLAAFADDQAQAAETTFGGTVLLRDAAVLADGSPAERVVVRWPTAAGGVLYQQQVLALVGDRAVTMAATFTARSRRALGPEVHRMMLSLVPPAETGAAAASGRRSGYPPYRP